MDSDQGLPFKTGQLAESKSFQTGFRGAWFRCKIKDIRKIKGHYKHSLEYFDFPDEKVEWTKLYQMPQVKGSQEKRKLHLMVRPSFPSVYRENEMPDTGTISEVIAIVHDVWSVGDLVDWWIDGCHWSGRITHLLGEDKVKIQLHNPPFGEGLSYEVSCKELRPSLEWSPEHGWTVPIPPDSEACRCCVRLIRPASSETGIVSSPEISCYSPTRTPKPLSLIGLKEETQKPNAVTSLDTSNVVEVKPRSPEILSGYGMKEETQKPCAVTRLELNDVNEVKPSFSDRVSTTHVVRESAATEILSRMKDPYIYDRPSKKLRGSGHDFLNLSFSDSIKSSILDLEELVTKIKWLKRVNQFGFGHANKMVPQWKFIEER